MSKGFFDLKSSKELFIHILSITYKEYKGKTDDYNLFLLSIALDSCIEWLKKENYPEDENLKKIFEIRETIIKKLANRAKHKMNKVGNLHKSGFILEESLIDGRDLLDINHKLDKLYFLTELEKLIYFMKSIYKLSTEEIA